MPNRNQTRSIVDQPFLLNKCLTYYMLHTSWWRSMSSCITDKELSIMLTMHSLAYSTQWVLFYPISVPNTYLLVVHTIARVVYCSTQQITGRFVMRVEMILTIQIELGWVLYLFHSVFFYWNILFGIHSLKYKALFHIPICVKGWNWQDFKSFWIWKQIEAFCMHPSVCCPIE